MKEMMVSVNQKKAGDTFGELALAIDKFNPDKVIKRAATIKTINESIFAVIGKADYR